MQGTSGAAFHEDLDIPHAQLVVRKGYHKDVDSYSAFLEADRKTSTGLAGYLKERGLTNLYLCGLARRSRGMSRGSDARVLFRGALLRFAHPTLA